MESRRLLLTYFTGRAKKKRAPQKIKPSPMKASTGESVMMEEVRDRMPGMRRATPILPEGIRRALKRASFNSSFSV